MTRIAHGIAPLSLAGSVALLTALPAIPATQSDPTADARPARSGMAATEGLDLAGDPPATDMVVGDRPYCADNKEIHGVLKADFNETPVDRQTHEGAHLWGSRQLGTWTLVAPRDDATSCIIASGIGYSSGRDVEDYYETAGLE